MDIPNPLQAAIDQLGLTALARTCQVSHQAVRKWQRQGRMPRTEWTGETGYAPAIEQATGGKVTKGQLLSAWAATPAPVAAPCEETRNAA